MKRLLFSVYGALFLALILVGVTTDTIRANGSSATITLTPSSGFATTTVYGSGFMFSDGYSVNITWDGTLIPTVPEEPTIGGAAYTFTAIISVPTQSSPGAHTVKAIAYMPGEPGSTENATAQFTVIDMTGPQGDIGPSGEGDQGPAGPAGPPGAEGPPGEGGSGGGIGPIPDSEWSETSLRFEDPNSPTGWGELVDLQGARGLPGEPGADGEAGSQGEKGKTGPAGGLSVAAIVMAVAVLVWMLIGLIRRVVLGR